MNCCIVETYRFSQSLHNPLSLPPIENLALVPQEGPSEFHTMPKSREGLASVGQEKRTLQLLPHPTHIRRHLSFPPLATLWPSGLQSTAYTYRQGQTGSDSEKQRARANRSLYAASLTSSAWPGRSVASFWAFTSHTFSVLSLLPLTNSRLSADQAIWYTAATWPRREARYLGRGGEKRVLDLQHVLCIHNSGTHLGYLLALPGSHARRF